MTASELIFGSGTSTRTGAAWGRLFGVSRETVRKWREDPGLIRLRDLRTIVRVKKMSDEDIVKLVRGRAR